MQKKEPLISVIIPAYNAAQDLERCVDSVLAQTIGRDALEIVIVEDGATDETPAIADRLAEQHSEVIVIHQENRGTSAARNRGIDASHGAYLGFVDADDTLLPGMYEALYDVIGRSGARIAQIGRQEIAPDGTRLPDVVRVQRAETLQDAEAFLKTLLLHTGDASLCTKLTERSLFTEESRFPEGRLNEDFYLLFRLMPEAGMIAILPERGYQVRYRENSNSRTTDAGYFPPVYEDIVRHADDAARIVKKAYPALIPAASRFALVQRLDYLLHIPPAQMRGDNAFYRDVCAYLKSHRAEIRMVPHLTKKQRRNLLILSHAPRLARTLHGLVKGKRIRGRQISP